MLKKQLRKIELLIHTYRYDFFSVSIILIAIILFFESLFQPGQVVFSDIDFPFNSHTYLEEIFGLWNGKWNTTSMLNIPRLIIVLPSFLLASLFKDNGSIFLKLFILQQSIISAFSIYLLSKRLVSVYYGKAFDIYKVFALIFGSLLYALNPYFIYRIQHIYLLVGYSFFPLVILYFLKVFDHKFQSIVIPSYSAISANVYYENYRDIFILSLLVTISSAAIHYFFYSVLALGIIFFLIITKYLFFKNQQAFLYRKNVIIAIMKKLMIFILVFALLSFYWLSIYIGSILVGAEASQHNINEIDTYTMFSRNSDIVNVALLDSYWWKMTTESRGIGFYIGGAIIIIVIAVGAVSHFKSHHMITLLTILGSLMMLLATGVKYPIIRNVFLLLCRLPFFGNVFRDPNKLIGLLAVSYSVLFIFGIETLVGLLKNKQIIKVGLFALLSASCIMYLLPMKYAFVDEYYHPIEVPKAYQDLHDEFSGSERYAVYLPTAEQMIRPIHNIATPRWNTIDSLKVKATGDVHIYNSPIETLFHHEGNDPGITYYLNYLQYLLDTGRSTNLLSYLNGLGADTFIYHDEYLDQNDRQDFNKNIIKSQPDMSLLYNNDIFDVYDLEVRSSTIKHTIWTPYGLSHLEAFHDLPGYDILQTPTVFISQDNRNFLDKSKYGDYVEMYSFNDIFLETLDDVYKVYPFKWVDELNPFMKWSKTYTGNPDWTWFMKQLDNKSRHFDYDQRNGVAVTFASGKLNIPPHEREKAEGQLVIDFDTMIRTDTFFKADTPELYEVQANPLIDPKSVGVVRGVLSKGDPKDIWQVAKSKLIPATENTPYVYNIVVSGREVNKLHVKVRYFDANRKEVGIQYVVAPHEVVDFEAVNFFGETVSPKGTKYMRLDLMSFQKPEQKSYWWIHDVNVYDYSEFKEKNIIKGSYEAKKSDVYDIYVKTFKSPSSGQMDIKIGKQKFQHDTVDDLFGFKWSHLGSLYLEVGLHDVEIENIQGFNSINQIVILPKSLERSLKIPVEKALDNASQILTFEGENNFYYEGNIQSERSYPKLSYGKGLALKNGSVTRDFEIVQDGFYDIDSYFSFYEVDDYAVLSIIDNNMEKVYEEIILPETVKNDGATINFKPLSKGYLYEFVNRNKSRLENEQTIKEIPLAKGDYRLVIDYFSHVVNHSPIEALDKFDSNSLLVSYSLESPFYRECSPCESINMDMFNHSIENDVLTITYDPTCSCDWYIYSSKKIPVNSQEELRVEFEAVSDEIVNRHGKLIYVDRFNHVVETQFIFEVEEEKKSNWHRYEQLDIVPEGASFVMLQFWARGHKENEGSLKIKNLVLEKYDEYASLDKLLIRQIKDVQQTPSANLNIVVDNDTRKNITIDKDDAVLLWNSFLSPSNLWRESNETYNYVLNGITMGYILDKSESKIVVVLSKVYLLGIILHLTTVVVCLIYLWKYKRRKI